MAVYSVVNGWLRKVFCLSILVIAISYIFFLNDSLIFADKPAPNIAYVRTSPSGRFYVKCIPYDLFTIEGKTYVCEMTDKGEKLLYTFDWYSRQVFIQDDCGSVVRIGPWPDGRYPSHEQLAIAFYVDGKEVKKYSTLDIFELGYKNKSAIQVTVSHYNVFDRILGYYGPGSKIFAVTTFEGRTLLFDALTGELGKIKEKNEE